MTLAEMLARRDALVAEARSNGMTDEARTELTDLKTRIAQAREDEALLVDEIRSTPAPVAVEARVATGRITTDERAADADAIDTRAALTDWQARGFSGKQEIRAVLTSALSVAARPDYLGLKPTIDAPLALLDLFPARTTDSSVIEYVVEVPKTNAAAVTAEGALKPEQDFALTVVRHALPMIPVFTTVSEQALRNVGELERLIEGRLTYNVRAKVNQHVIIGNPNAVNGESGLMGISSTGTSGGGETDGIERWKALGKAKYRLTGASGVTPTHIFLNPDDFWMIESALMIQNQTLQNLTQIHGMTAVVDPLVGEGIAFLGSPGNPDVNELVVRDTLRVEKTNSHADNFTHNLVTIRAEQEAELCVYRPAAWAYHQFS